MAAPKLTKGCSAGALNADFLASTPLDEHDYVCVQIAGTYSGTISFQGSNDDSTWDAVVLNRSDDATGAVAASTTASSVVYDGVVPYAYFRVRMTSYSSGTATGAVVRKQVFAPPSRVA